MDAMDQQRLTLEIYLGLALGDSMSKLVDKINAIDSIWWKCVFIIPLLVHFLVDLLVLLLVPILVSIRLAITNADRVVFVLASSFLAFYQVPLKVFYIYIAVLAFTGFLQFLRYDSRVRIFVLACFTCISCGTSDMFLRKFTTLHFSNPFNRCFTRSQVVYFPVGLEIPSSGGIEVFDFPVSEHLNFDKTVGNCRIKIETLNNMTGTCTIRDLYVEAPWGWNRFTVDMEDDNLGRLISYFNRAIETNCKELICTPVPSGLFHALSILGAVKHFNSGVQLVKLEAPDEVYIH